MIVDANKQQLQPTSTNFRHRLLSQSSEQQPLQVMANE